MIKRYSVYLLGIIGGFALLIILYLLYNIITQTDIILTITAVIIYVYSYETYKLRKATVDHTEIYTRPVLILYLDPDNRSEEVLLKLHNFGNSPAYIVAFEKTQFRLEKPASVEWRLKLQNVGVVPPEGDIKVLLGDTENESEYDRVDGKGLFKFINGARIRGETYSFITTVVYDDIVGHRWKSDLGYSSTTGIIARKPEMMMDTQK